MYFQCKAYQLPTKFVFKNISSISIGFFKILTFFYVYSYSFVPGCDMLTIAAEEATRENKPNKIKNRISKIPFGRIRKELCFRFLFDCLFFVPLLGLSLRHAYHFCKVYSIVFDEMTFDGRDVAACPRHRSLAREVEYFKRHRVEGKRSKKIISSFVPRLRSLRHPRLRNGIPVIILDPIVV